MSFITVSSQLNRNSIIYMEGLDILVHNRAITIFYCHLLLGFFKQNIQRSLIYFLIQTRQDVAKLILREISYNHMHIHIYIFVLHNYTCDEDTAVQFSAVCLMVSVMDGQNVSAIIS